MSDVRDRYIGQVVAGQTFAEVGGLWGTVNEKVSVAHSFGARELVMHDIAPIGADAWTKLEERRAALGLPDVHCVSGDIVELTESGNHGSYDVVHCPGVLYHAPDQIRLLRALRKVARRHVILTSVVMPSRVETEEGVLDLPDSGVLFAPALQGRERAIVRAHWLKIVDAGGAIGVTREGEWNLENYVPWWWLPTVPALKAMCAAAGFEVVDASPSWNGFAQTLLLKVVGTA